MEEIMISNATSGLYTVRFYAEQRGQDDQGIRFFDGESSFYIPEKAIISNRVIKGRDREIIVERWAAEVVGIV